MATTDTLPDTLKELVGSGTDSHAALNVLISDYARFHLVLVLVGGLFLLIMLALSVFFWRRFTRAQRTELRKWTFERRTYFVFGVVSVLVSLFLALIVAANVSNVVNPRHGFSGSLPLLSAAAAGTQAAEVHQSFETWLQSGSPDVPSVVQAAVDDRLSWQRPKAIICTVLLVAFALLSAAVWRILIRKSRVREGRRPLAEWGLLLLGIVAVGACLVLMLMVMGNTQASLAPLSMTLFYG